MGASGLCSGRGGEHFRPVLGAGRGRERFRPVPGAEQAPPHSRGRCARTVPAPRRAGASATAGTGAGVGEDGLCGLAAALGQVKHFFLFVKRASVDVCLSQK